APVEDDRARDERDLEPVGAVVAAREQLGRYSGRRLEPVERAACEADRIDELDPGAADGRRAAANVRRARDRAAREVEDRAAGRALLVLRDADLEPRKVEAQLRPVEARVRNELGRVVREGRHRRVESGGAGGQAGHDLGEHGGVRGDLAKTSLRMLSRLVRERPRALGSTLEQVAVLVEDVVDDLEEQANVICERAPRRLLALRYLGNPQRARDRGREE